MTGATLWKVEVTSGGRSGKPGDCSCIGGRLLAGRDGLRGTVPSDCAVAWVEAADAELCMGTEAPHGGDTAAGSGCSAGSGHADEDGGRAHEPDIGWTDANELIGDARLRHHAVRTVIEPRTNGPPRADDARDHRTDVHVTDARGGQELIST